MAIGCLAAACTSAGDGESGPDTSSEVLGSTASDETTEAGDTSGGDEADPAAPAQVEPTRDGSASVIVPVTDVWTVEGDGVLTPNEPASTFADVAVGDDGRVVVGGRLVDHRDRLTRAAVWQSAEDPRTDLTLIQLPNLATGVDSSVADVAIPSTGTGPALDGILTVAVGYVGQASGQRIAVWVERDDGWEPVSTDTFDSIDRTWGSELIVGTEQLLLLGGTTGEDGESEVVVWSSPDATTWTPTTEPFDERPESSLVDGAVAEVGTVLIGQEDADGFTESLVWFSADGVAWEVLDPPSFRGDGSVVVNSVAAAPQGGFVAVGSVGTEADVFQPASWSSADGRTWSEPSTSFEQNDLGRTTSGGLGAREVHVVGDQFLATSTGSFLPHVWTSDDGVDWVPLGDVLDAGLESLSMDGIGAAGDTITLVGEGRLVQRLSGTWTNRRIPGEVIPQPSEIPWINDIASTGSGFLAVGGIEDTDGSLLGRAWAMSVAGVWEPATFSVFRPTDIETGPYQEVVATADGYLTIGAETNELSTRRDRWGATSLHSYAQGEMRRPAMAEVDDARLVLAEMALVGDQVVLGGFSFDGDVIEPLIFEGSLHPETFDRLTFNNSDADDRTALGPVSIGTPRVADREAFTALCASPDTAAAVLLEDDSSSVSLQFYRRGDDGSWDTATFDPGFGPDGNSPSAGQCIHGPAGFVAIGGFRAGDEGDFEAAMWSSPDGTGWSRVDGLTATAFEATELRFDDLAVFEDSYLLAGSKRVDGVWSAVLWIGTPGGDWLEVPGSNQPVDFDIAGVAVDDAGTVVLAGWQDGQATVVSAPIGDLLTLS
ncbi:MAG: hypothetical protein AAFO29_03375 [Actinomycetota bacterium]